MPPPAHPIWEPRVQAKAGHCTGHCCLRRCAGYSCPQRCAGPWHGEHLWTGLHLFRAGEEELWWHLERPYGTAAFSETISKWFTFEKGKKPQNQNRHTDCAPLQKSSILLRSFTYYTGWTRQSFNKRLHWRAEQEPVRLQKKCRPQKINTVLHHVQVRRSTTTWWTCTPTLQEKLSQLSRKQQVPH